MKDVNHNELVEKLAVKLKDVTIAPDWAQFAKTGHGRQRPPTRRDWWQVRAAAVLLSVETRGPIGVSKLSIKYGNNKNRGNSPNGFAPGSRNVLRKVLQQLEAAKLIEQTAIGVHKGRVVTNTGNKLIIETKKDMKKAPNRSEASAPLTK